MVQQNQGSRLLSGATNYLSGISRSCHHLPFQSFPWMRVTQNSLIATLHHMSSFSQISWLFVFSSISCQFHFPIFFVDFLTHQADLWWQQSSVALYFLQSSGPSDGVTWSPSQFNPNPEILSEWEFPLPSCTPHTMGWEAKSSINGVPPCPPKGCLTSNTVKTHWPCLIKH